MRLRGALLILLCWGVCRLHARQVPKTQVSPEFVRSTLASLESLIKEHYFKTEEISKIDAALEAALRDGNLTKTKDVEQLATVLTETLYQASHDKHLFVSVTTQAAAAPEQSPLPRAEEARLSNYGIKAAEVLDGNVGYLKVTAFYRANEGAADTLDVAMRFLSHSDALILDLRENGGGAPDTAVQLLSYLFAQSDLPLFRVIPRSGDVVIYRTTAIDAAARDESRPAYVLVSRETWSAGEGVPFLLQERHRATILGERTAGAANPAGPWPVNGSLTVTIPFGHIESAVQGKNWEGSGVMPDIATPPHEALRVAYVCALKNLLQKTKSTSKKQIIAGALAKAKNSTCPSK